MNWLNGKAQRVVIVRYWAVISGMKFNKGKYKVPHVGWSTAKTQAQPGKQMAVGKDLGVSVPVGSE